MSRATLLLFLALSLCLCPPSGRAADGDAPVVPDASSAALATQAEPADWLVVDGPDRTQTWLDPVANRYPIPRLYARVGCFIDGYAVAEMPPGKAVNADGSLKPWTLRACILDPSGKVVLLLPEGLTAYNLGHGHFMSHDSATKAYGRLDLDGTLTPLPDLETVYHSNAGLGYPLVALSREFQLKGLLNERLEWVDRPRFHQIRVFYHSKLTRARLPNAKSWTTYTPAPSGNDEDPGHTMYHADWHVIDTTGTVRFVSDYEEFGSFMEGLVPVMIADRFGFMDEQGDLVLDPVYTEVWSGFINGLAHVSLPGARKDGIFIDHQGTVIQPPAAAAAFRSWSRREGPGTLLWTDSGDGVRGAIDMEGREVIPPLRRQVESVPGREHLAKTERKDGDTELLGLYDEQAGRWLREESPLPPMDTLRRATPTGD